MSRDGTVLTYAGIEYRSHEGKWVDEYGNVASLGTSRELDAATQNKVAQTEATLRAAQRASAPMRSMMRAARDTVVHLRDVGGECWVPCAKGDPGATAFIPQ